MAVRGYLDVVTHESITGWAWDAEQPGQAVVLDVLVDGRSVARVAANLFRQDLQAEGIGDGRHAFAIDATKLGLPLTSAVVSVQAEASGEHLERSPWRLETSLELSEEVRRAFSALLDSPGSDQDLLDRSQFLAQQVERLLQRVSDRQSSRAERIARQGRKWRWRAEDGPAPAPLTPRALVIDSTLPAAGRDAGSNAIVSHMQSLQRLGFAVTFAPADMAADVAAGSGSAMLAELGIATAGAPWFASVEEVLRRQSGGWDLIYLHRVDIASRYMALAKHYAARARILYSVADLHSLRLFRQAAVEDRPELVPHGNFVRNQELAAAAACHAVLTHSAAEAALLRQWLPHANSRVVPWAFPLRPTPAGFEARAGVLFVGSFGHPPNLDAAIWLMDEIMPLVWQQDPAIECLVAGSGMAGAPFAGRDARIRVLGRVEDLHGLLNQVRLTVAPLAYGAGLKGKVGDSLAAGVPCVCSPIAAEGYALPGPLLELIGKDAAGLAESIVRLHGSREAFEACRTAGLAYVGAAFCEATVDAALRDAAGLPVAGPIATAEAIVAMVEAAPVAIEVTARPQQRGRGEARAN